MANWRSIIKGTLTRWGAAQVERLKQAFNVGGHLLHGGAQWPPNKDGSSPLKGTGQLKNSTYFVVQGQTVELGNSDPVAVFHQNGTKDLPKREVVVVTGQDIAELKRNLQIELENALRRM